MPLVLNVTPLKLNVQLLTLNSIHLNLNEVFLVSNTFLLVLNGNYFTLNEIYLEPKEVFEVLIGFQRFWGKKQGVFRGKIGEMKEHFSASLREIFGKFFSTRFSGGSFWVFGGGNLVSGFVS